MERWWHRSNWFTQILFRIYKRILGRTIDYRLPLSTNDYKLQTTHYELPTTNYRLRTWSLPSLLLCVKQVNHDRFCFTWSWKIAIKIVCFAECTWSNKKLQSKIMLKLRALLPGRLLSPIGRSPGFPQTAPSFAFAVQGQKSGRTASERPRGWLLSRIYTPRYNKSIWSP